MSQTANRPKSALRLAREAKGWSREKLAVEAGVTLQTVMTLENGGGTTIRTARKFGAALGASIDTLFPEVEASA